MEEIQELVQDRLRSVSDIDDKRLLRPVLEDVYLSVVDYNMDMYRRLEDRIYHEMPDPLAEFYIYTTLQDTKHVDLTEDFMYPILPSDMEEHKYDLTEMKQKMQKNGKVILASLFLACDQPMFQTMLEKDKSYKGFIHTEKNVYEIAFKLEQSRKYIECIEELYRAFQANHVEWNTVNCPYAYKFVDLVLTGGLTMADGENIKEISFDLAEYEGYKRPNTIPLWNVRALEVVTKSFPNPAKDTINYDHPIDLTEHGIDDGYLLSEHNTDYLYTKRLEKDFVVISGNRDQTKWQLVQIKNECALKKERYNYEVLSNKRNIGFIGRFASIKRMVIRTRAEIARILQFYELSQELSFQDIEVRRLYKKQIQTTNFNSFIDDNIRNDNYKDIAILTFKAHTRDDFLIYDKMSFLVSEIQFLFPEYKFIGELS